MQVRCSVHGIDKIEAGLSDFYLVDDIHGIYRGMMIAIAPVHGQCFSDCTLNQLGVKVASVT